MLHWHTFMQAGFFQQIFPFLPNYTSLSTHFCLRAVSSQLAHWVLWGHILHPHIRENPSDVWAYKAYTLGYPVCLLQHLGVDVQIIWWLRKGLKSHSCPKSNILFLVKLQMKFLQMPESETYVHLQFLLIKLAFQVAWKFSISKIIFNAKEISVGETNLFFLACSQLKIQTLNCLFHTKKGVWKTLKYRRQTNKTF